LLKNVLGAYLDKMKERQLDLPLLLLLPEMGFEDVHFTHGAEEHGKDFVAKKRENGKVIQYAIQSKVGDINLVGQLSWASPLLNQRLASANRSHCLSA